MDITIEQAMLTIDKHAMYDGGYQIDTIIYHGNTDTYTIVYCDGHTMEVDKEYEVTNVFYEYA
jgi:prepilin-type processing-associated H-X9-DG protein